MKVWIPNNRNRLKKILLGSVPTVELLADTLGRQIPEVIQRVLEETREDLEVIKESYGRLGVEVISYPVVAEDVGTDRPLAVRDGLIVIDGHAFITDRFASLEPFYSQLEDRTFVHETGTYCPDIYINDHYAILDKLPPGAYRFWRDLLGKKRKIITAFNDGHSDGIYCNVGDKIWLTNGDALPFKKHWPDMPVLELSTTNGGVINDWAPVEDFHRSRELEKTQGRYLVVKQELAPGDIDFIDQHLPKWTGYCEESIFDINMSIIDQDNVMVIKQDSRVYDQLGDLGIAIHQVPFRHRWFWDGGLHCITNDLVRGY